MVFAIMLTSKTGALENFAKSSGKYLCWSLFKTKLQACTHVKTTQITSPFGQGLRSKIFGIQDIFLTFNVRSIDVRFSGGGVGGGYNGINT